MKQIGTVVEDLETIGMVVVDLTDTVKLGDQVVFKFESEEVPQTVEAIQIGENAVEMADEGDRVGIHIDHQIPANAEVWLQE